MNMQLLIDCIQTYATRHSNPVLSVLPEHGAIELMQKYPDPILNFSGAGLRAYYHCHPAVTRPDAEHGHFHIFVQTGDMQWSHLAGLSMDKTGQPVQWFTVNRWVTGGDWGDQKKLLAILDDIDHDRRLALTETWLLSMLKVYRSRLAELLVNRDQKMEFLCHQQDRDAVMEDRELYTLSFCSIDLLNDIGGDIDSQENLYT